MEDWERAQADNPGFVIPKPGAEREWVKEEFKRRLDNPKYSSEEKSSSYLPWSIVVVRRKVPCNFV